ncbi:MAG: hypothetical protein ACRD6X_09945 [Pyrinomonadaceae bacterium]
MMNEEARNAFEIKFKYSRAFWLGITGFHIAMIVLMWIIKPAAFDVTFSSLILDENRILVVLIALVSVWVLLGLRKKDEYAAYVLDLRVSQNLLAAGYLHSSSLALSVTCWGMFLALYIDYAYSFVWFAVGLFGALYVIPIRAKYDAIFRRLNADIISR